MKLDINGNLYDVVITRKNIKNMYMRVKEDKRIYVSANYLISSKTIEKFINNNTPYLIKMIDRVEKIEEKKKYFNYLGNKYDIVFANRFNKPYFDEEKVFVKDTKALENFLKKESEKVFKERLDICFEQFKENIPYPKLMIRKMKKKWGYCNKRDKLIKLNFELIKYDIREIDYVIIHELCHFIHFNHSRSFWEEVKKIKPNYKESQKILKES